MSSNPNDRAEFPGSAAEWLARRDRGLTPEEQDRYLEWLQADPANRAAMAALEQAWSTLDQLKEWRPSNSALPNPDLLAPAPSPVRWAGWNYLLAAAAVFLVSTVLFFTVRQPEAVAEQHAIIHPAAECLVLEDGSTVKLNAGAQVDVRYTGQERRVVLLRGEGLFTVAKNPERPFIVVADCVAVRAVGTAFAVSLNRQAVSVLVTEGKVQVDETEAGTRADAASRRELSHVAAGQQAVIALPEPGRDGARGADIQLREVTIAEIERALAWQNLRLEFIDMPLRQVVTEFNRYNVRKLSVADEATGAIVIGGSFRADQVESFVRLLGTGFGVSSSVQDDRIVLRKEP